MTIADKRVQDHTRNEAIQCYIRFGAIFIAYLVAALFEPYPFSHDIVSALIYISLYLGTIIFYLLWIKRKPKQFMQQRILIFMFSDILVTSVALHLAGSLSAVFVGFYLWYIIGFGMRFGVRYALIGTILTIIAWTLVFFTSEYWYNHPHQAIGWMLTFISLPLYYFLLVKRLHTTLNQLNTSLEKTEKLANHDSLTGLYNRFYFAKQADEILSNGQQLAIFMLDLDGFKLINDDYGHDTGDQLLICIAKVLRKSCIGKGLVGRLGGDEFIIATVEMDRHQVMSLAEKILSDVATASNEYGQVTASIGICFCPGDAVDLSRAKSCADTAMYTAKKQGKNRYHFYQQQTLS